MKFSHLNRRVHLYCGLFLLPWFFIYGVSSIPFSHPALGRQIYEDGRPQWDLRFERQYELPVPADGNLREIGSMLVKEANAEGAFGASRPNPNRINVYVHTFWTATQLSYDIPGKRLRAEDRRFRWDQFLTGLHARGGFHDESILNDTWAIVVDIVCLGFLIWIATGLYMWWHLPQCRGWGLLALGAGTASFALFMLVL